MSRPPLHLSPLSNYYYWTGRGSWWHRNGCHTVLRISQQSLDDNILRSGYEQYFGLIIREMRTAFLAHRLSARSLSSRASPEASLPVSLQKIVLQLLFGWFGNPFICPTLHGTLLLLSPRPRSTAQRKIEMSSFASSAALQSIVPSCFIILRFQDIPVCFDLVVPALVASRFLPRGQGDDGGERAGSNEWAEPNGSIHRHSDPGLFIIQSEPWAGPKHAISRDLKFPSCHFHSPRRIQVFRSKIHSRVEFGFINPQQRDSSSLWTLATLV